MSTQTPFHLFAAHDGSTVDEPGRRRKAHRKSRAGCGNCRSRKIKCDEALPHCKACLKRGLQCLYTRKGDAGQQDSLSSPQSSTSFRTSAAVEHTSSEQSLELASITRNLTPVPVPMQLDQALPSLHPLDVLSIDPPEIKLLRHFEVITSEILPQGQVFWKEIVSTIAMKNSYVMHAVLTIAASHRRLLRPSSNSVQYYELECAYYNSALSGLRDALSYPVSQDNFDPLLTSSILLLFHSWTFIDAANAYEVDFPVDDVLVITPGLRDIVVQARDKKLSSIFGSVITKKIELPKQQMLFPELQELGYPLDPKRTDNPYAGASSLMMSILSATMRDNSPETRRCLFAWPALCPKEYIEMVQQNDQQALAILAHFYAAASTQQMPCDWLFAKRSSFMCRSIVNRLGGDWEKYLTIPKTICPSS